MPTSPATSTRTQALETAERLLVEHGYLGVSMDDVAKGVGIRKASLYHHFPGGKEQLMMDLAEKLFSRDEAGFRQAISNNSGARAQLQALTEWMFSVEHRTERMLRDAMRFMDGEHQRTLGQHFYTRLFAPVEHVMRQGIQTGEFREHNTHLSAMLFMASLSEMHEARHRQRNPNLTQEMLDLFITGIGKPP